METKDYLAYLSGVIHTTIAATVDDQGLPVTAAIDMMDSDENSLYFLTARGKSFYDRLSKQQFLALTGIKGIDYAKMGLISMLFGALGNIGRLNGDIIIFKHI